MSVTVIEPGRGAIRLDPSDVRTVAFDWDKKSLRSGVTISSSTFNITAVQQSDDEASLTSDSASILGGAAATAACERTIGDSRVTQVRLIATTATDGDEYDVENVISTNESPAQTKAASVRVLIEQQ